MYVHAWYQATAWLVFFLFLISDGISFVPINVTTVLYFSGRAMEKALQFYEESRRFLERADVEKGAEVHAGNLLLKAIAELSENGKSRPAKRRKKNVDEEEQRHFLATLHMLYGRIVEWKEPERALEAYTSSVAALPKSPEANFQVARLQWKCAHLPAHMNRVEKSLRNAIAYAEDGEEEDDEMWWQFATELLGRFLCQKKGHESEGHTILREELGFEYVLHRKLTSGSIFPSGMRNRNNQTGSTSKYVNAFDDVLPSGMLKMMQGGFGRDAKFWKENHYGDPRTGFFSFQHKLPPFGSLDHAGGSVQSGMDSFLHHIWKVSSTAVPEVKKATYVEWWAHSRAHCYGHQIHYDSIPGNKKGSPKHPIISAITFLTADCGGPTLVTDQTISSQQSTKGWLAHPKTNRMVCFRGSQLHCVLPGAGHSPSKNARRTTFMAAFWLEDPCHGIDFASLARTPQKRKGSKVANGSCPRWPLDFENGHDDSKTSHAWQKNESVEAITPLAGRGIWESLKQDKKNGTKALDMMSDKLCKLSEGLLGVGFPSEKLSY